MPRLDLEAIPQTNASDYPAPFDQAVAGRWNRRLSPTAGLSLLGASHVVLKPGAWSSQRHWHRSEDELLVMLSGEAMLIEDTGRTVIRPGDICAWPAGAENGHNLINESDEDCCFVVVSAGTNTGGWYSDIDMQWTADDHYLTKNGRDYAAMPDATPDQRA